VTPLARCQKFLRVHVFPFECEFDSQGNVVAEDDGNDPGGVTKYGIDQRSHPRVDIRALDEAGATRIYLREWMDAPCDELPCPLGELLFDVLVNGGPAARWMQEALGVTADGFIGPKTLEQAQWAAKSKGAMRHVINSVCDAREERFRRLARQSMYRRYLKGWMRRSDALRALCMGSLGASSVVGGPQR
jgi:lysozyme family protein